MKIVHVGPFKLGTEHGHFNALWDLARSQARAGHEVTIMRVGKQPPKQDVEIASKDGVNLIGFPTSRWRGMWHDPTGIFATYMRELTPDIVHLFYVRVPKYLYVSRFLRNINVPYVITLHSGMNPVEWRRHRFRKIAYWRLVEREVHIGAAGIHFVTSKERNDYCGFADVVPRTVGVVPYAVCLPDELPSWNQFSVNQPARLCYFGRFDPWCKGLDLLAELSRHLRKLGLETDIHLYGSPGKRFVTDMEKLFSEYKDVTFVDHGLKTGHEKYSALAESDLYVQYSRYEGFGLSLVEAMAVGVPSALSENADLAPELIKSRAALQLEMDPNLAAQGVLRVLMSREEQAELSKRGAAWVRENCDPSAVERQMTSFYEAAIRATR